VHANASQKLLHMTRLKLLLEHILRTLRDTRNVLGVTHLFFILNHIRLRSIFARWLNHDVAEMLGQTVRIVLRKLNALISPALYIKKTKHGLFKQAILLCISSISETLSQLL